MRTTLLLALALLGAVTTTALYFWQRTQHEWGPEVRVAWGIFPLVGLVAAVDPA